MTLSKVRIAGVGLLLSVLLIAAANAEKDTSDKGYASAVFAGGCFWCMVHPFDELPGVLKVISGYTGGHKVNPTYKEVSSGDTGHVEAVQIVYDPARISYDKLLDVYWHNIDPLDAGGQFCDRGSTYKSVIFYGDEQQAQLAQRSRAALAKRLKHPIVTEVRPAGPFYPAEDYHQNYYQKNPLRYRYYRYACGRDQRLRELWSRKD